MIWLAGACFLGLYIRSEFLTYDELKVWGRTSIATVEAIRARPRASDVSYIFAADGRLFHGMESVSNRKLGNAIRLRSRLPVTYSSRAPSTSALDVEVIRRRIEGGLAPLALLWTFGLGAIIAWLARFSR